MKAFQDFDNDSLFTFSDYLVSTVRDLHDRIGQVPRRSFFPFPWPAYLLCIHREDEGSNLAKKK